MQQIQLLINGEKCLASHERFFERRNPLDGEVATRAPAASVADAVRAVEAAKREGIVADGPFPPDTVFVRATKGAFDAVLTMYHDQGQIAMKLIGFDRGVTLLGGFPFPICTPAHGSAYDIAGQGIAGTGATRAALLLAARMGAQRRAGAAAA